MAKQGTQPQAMDQRPDGASAEGLANTPASSGASGRFELDTARLLRAISDCHAASLGIAQALASRGAGSASTQRSQRASLSGGPVRLTNAALDALDEGVVLVGADARVALVNSAACDLLGLEAVVARAALIDAPMRELFRQLHPVDTDGGGHDFGSFLKCPGGQHDGYMVRLAGQRDYGVSLEVRALGEEGWLLVLRRDDGARDDEQRLRVAEQEYQSLFENAVIGIYRSSFDGRQLRANPALVRLNGYDSEEELLRSVNDIAAEWYVDPGRREAFKRELDTHGRVTDFVSEIYRHKTRERIWISENAWVVRDPAGTPLFYEGTVVDASDRMAAEEEINHLAHHDHLTGLPNRFMLLKKLREALLQPQTASTVAVLCLDLDHFKDVNDTLGHQAGDRLLVSVGKRLRRSIKAGDVLARLGGDEFTVLQAGVRSERDTEALARRIVQALSEPFMIGETEVSIGVSVGIAGFAGQEPADLLRDADVALYEAKRGGRGRFAHYTDAMGEALRDRRALEDDLRVAIEQGNFEIYTQPIHDVETGEASVYEALLRWKHPTRGEVSPSRFVSIAEEASLMVALGDWVLDNTVAVAKRLPKGKRIAMNLSPIQLRDPRFVERVTDALARHEVNPDQLEIEITETVIMTDDSRTVEALHSLRDMGLRLALDDFGTGHASLSYLQRFRFDKVKIDQSFVRRVVDDPISAAVVRAVASLGADLGADVVAEGVETQAQVDALRREGCRLFQGYLFGKPQPWNTVFG